MTKLFILFLCIPALGLFAQELAISGKITDVEKNPLSFVNVLIYKTDSDIPFKGSTTDKDGFFELDGLTPGTYNLNFSYVGFESSQETVELTSNKNFGDFVLRQNAEMLDETVVTAKLPTIKKTADKLVFNVENTSFSVGNTMDLLKKTPGVLVIGDKIQVRLSTPVIFINGKRVYLSDSEVASLLENTDAANIKSIEVITSPSSKYDADAHTVLNIVTSKPISVGYKGSVNATYEQGIYPKYNFGTSHFYKNNWLNLYASYNYDTKKEYKEDENYIRFFQPDAVSTKSIWETNFNRTTDFESHNGNIVLDFTLDDKNSLSLTSNVSLSPNVTYNNYGASSIFDAQHQLDSTITTLSAMDLNRDNLTFALDYNRKLNDEGSSLSASANYVYYDKTQGQTLSSDYFLANGDFLRNKSFYTNSLQNSNIFTGQTDYSTALWGGTFEAGLKFSNIDTHSKLDFFDTVNSSNIFNNALSDDFNYKENVYAEYLNFERNWGKWTITAGLRGEYTDIDAISLSLGEVNTQQYFELFPSASFHYNLNQNNGIGLSYGRSIHRPRYQSLNPFKYFITENNFNSGNPNLVPAIEDRITLSFDHKNKLFFSLYYQNVKDKLALLSFQDNNNSTLRSIDTNLLKEYQYSFDILYYNSLTSWWWFQVSTSTFYLANESYALESTQEAYKNDTFGQYIQTVSNFSLTQDRSLTADLSGVYLSNFVFGNQSFKNQFSTNLSLRKEFWDKRASITVGVDDVFNTNNVPVITKYFNQDNSYFANEESRLFRLGLKYNFGNARLRDNNKQIQTDEGKRLGE